MSYLKKIIQHHELINPLKNFLSNVVLANHQLIVPLTRNRKKEDFKIEPSLWVKFDAENFDGIQLIGFLNKNSEIISSANCTFTINTVSIDDLWTETIVTTVPGVNVDNRFIVAVPSSSFGFLDLDGEVTLSVEMSIERMGITYKKKIYVNHMGIYDSIFRLKQDVEFLDITKVDE